MRVEGKSLIIDTLERGINRVDRWLSDSRILTAVRRLYPQCERSRWERLRKGERVRIGALRAVEQSRLLWQLKKLKNRLTETSVGSIGAFGLLYALLTMIGLHLIGDADPVSALPSLAFVLVLFAPWLAVRQSLGYALRRGRLTGWFLFSFCAFSRFSCTGSKKGVERPLAALLIALIFALLCIRFSALAVWGGVALMLFLALLFALPELGVCLTVTALPWLEYLPHPTVALCALVSVSVAAWLYKALCGRRRFVCRTPDLLAILFALLTLLCTLTGYGSRAQGTVSVLLILFFFPVRNLLVERLWRQRATAGICFTGTLVSLIGVLQYLFGRAELRWVDTARFGDIGGRVCGPFSNPNVFAVYLLGITPLLLCECLDGARRRGWRLFCGVGFFLSATAILFTFTRGAWLGILLSVLTFLVLFSRRSAALLCLSVLPIGALLPMLPHRITNRFLSIGSLAESSVSYRLHTWRGVLRMISRHRFGIGVGEQAFSCVYPRYAVSGTERVMHAHNLYLQILAESGMVGFLIFLALLGALLLCALWRLSLADGAGERTECLGALCALIGILTMAFFDHVWYHFGMLCWFFVIAAMLTLPSERILEREGLL